MKKANVPETLQLKYAIGCQQGNMIYVGNMIDGKTILECTLNPHSNYVINRQLIMNLTAIVDRYIVMHIGGERMKMSGMQYMKEVTISKGKDNTRIIVYRKNYRPLCYFWVYPCSNLMEQILFESSIAVVIDAYVRDIKRSLKRQGWYK